MGVLSLLSLQLLIIVLTLGSADINVQRNYEEGISDEDALVRARLVLSQYPLVDGHNDLPGIFRKRIRNQQRLVDLSKDVSPQWGPSHTDIPRLREGMVGAQFWSAFVNCVMTTHRDAVRRTLEQIDITKVFVNRYPDDFKLVTTASGIEDAFEEGKIASLIGIEGGHGIDSSFAVLRMVYRLGARYMTLTHNCNTVWADSSKSDDPEEREDPVHWGLTQFGRDLVTEMNRIGMMIDISHTSRLVQLEVIKHSRAPVIYSHSNVWRLAHVDRNVHDDVLVKMAQKGGLIMVTFVGRFLDTYPSNHTTADIKMVADVIEHVRNLVGVNHIGIGSDFDGTTRLPEGLEDVSKFPYLFAELVKRGWAGMDLQKLAGRNLVRVFREVESWVPKELKLLGYRPADRWITEEELDAFNPNRPDCRTSN